ncbi:MAG: Wzz/FepE/Etk N-terminal domain-containing protein [Marmoricola sp.]
MAAQRRTATVDDGLVDFSEYLQVLRRRKWLIVVGLVLGALAGSVAFDHRSESYTSATKVQVKPITTDAISGLDAAKIDMATQQQLASSTAVAQLAQQRLRTARTPSQLVRGLVVTTAAQSNALLIKYTAATPQGTQSAAAAFADSYLAVRRAQATSLVAKLTVNLRSRLSTQQTQLTKVQSTIATAPRGTTEYTTALALQSSLSQQVGTLQSRIDDLAGLIIDPGSVIALATLPGKPDGFGLPLFLAGGALIGLVLFVLLAFLRDRSDDRLQAPADIERNLGLPLLGALPGRRRGDGRLLDFGVPLLSGALPDRKTRNGRLPELDDAGPELQEAYGAILARLHVASRDNQRLLMVTSPLDQQDATTTAASLAVGLARSDQRVALVVSDMSKSPVDWLLESPGLERRTPDETPFEGAARVRSTIPTLDVWFPRASDGEARQYLNPKRMQVLLQQLRKHHEFVVVVAPPVLISADALVLATIVDSVLLVVTRLRAKRNDIVEAVEQLNGVGSHLLGVVVHGDRLSRDRRGRLRRRHQNVVRDRPALEAGGSAGDPGKPTGVLQRS